MPRFAWAVALATLLILAARLTFLDSDLKTASCAELELAFESADFNESLASKPVLIIGNQRVHYWNTPIPPLQTRDVIRRSSVGLNPDRIEQCFPRLVGYYQPSVVILPLDTAFALNVDESSLIDTLQRIVDQRSEYSLDFELWVIAPITTPRYASAKNATLDPIKEAGAKWASSESRVWWLDLQDRFVDEDGDADSKLVWPNGNTLNETGYQRLTEALITLSNERK